MAPIELRNKPICITGASSGIGAATARACAAAGMPVALGARRVERCEALAIEIRAGGGRALAIRMDVDTEDDHKELIERCVREFGSVYAVFANAGYGVERAGHVHPERELRAMFETNFWGTMRTIWAATPRLIEARGGHVLICSSCVARFSLPYFGGYCATKGAQHLMGRAMRLELEPMGVHVSTVHPVGTRTEFFETAQRLSGSTRLIEHTRERFMQAPEAVARAIVRCMRRPRAEVWPSPAVRFGMAFAAAFPSLGDAGVRWMVRERTRQAGARSGSRS